MKDVQIFESPVNNLSYRTSSFKLEHMYQNQGRTFGPLLGLFLVNLLAKVVTAKYDPYFPVHLSYDPSPWLPYNKPLSNYNYHSYYPHWYPVKNPYNYEPPSYQSYPTLTTATPFVSSEHLPSDYDSDYAQDYNYRTNTQESNNYERLIPAESTIRKQSTLTPFPPRQNTTIPTTTTTQNPTTTVVEHVAAESNVKSKRHPTQRSRRRGPTRRNKYPQKRRRTTTPPPEDYYDSYEDYTERPPNRRRRPKPSIEYYDDGEDNNNYYDSYEATTRYFNKQKRRPTRKIHKPPPRVQEQYEIEANTEHFNPNTEIVIVRQAQSTTSTSTTESTISTSTTTEPTTLITNSTTSPTTTSTSANNGTYGYGPSNGNEQVSFTYGPPTGKNPYQYSVPYFDWYTHEATRNAIVKRVRDIVIPTK